MEALNLNLRFEKLYRCTVVVAKSRGSEIFNFIFNFVLCRNLVHLGDLECLLCVHKMVCVFIMWYVCHKVVLCML